MKRISILKDFKVTNQADFETSELASEWLERHRAMGSFGDVFDVEIIDVTSEIEAEKAKKEKKEAIKLKLKDFDKTKVKTVAACADVLADIAELLK